MRPPPPGRGRGRIANKQEGKIIEMTNQDNDSTRGARITMVAPATPCQRMRVPTRATLALDATMLLIATLATVHLAVQAIFSNEALLGFVLGLVAIACLASRLYRQVELREEAVKQAWFTRETSEPSAMWYDPDGDLILVYPGHWPNRQELARMLSRLEDDGYIANDDDVTRALRVELGLSG